MMLADPAESRLFGDWTMCARTLSPAAAPALKALELDGDFDPFALTGERALQVLQVLVRFAPPEPLRRAG